MERVSSLTSLVASITSGSMSWIVAFSWLTYNTTRVKLHVRVSVSVCVPVCRCVCLSVCLSVCLCA